MGRIVYLMQQNVHRNWKYLLEMKLHDKQSVSNIAAFKSLHEYEYTKKDTANKA